MHAHLSYVCLYKYVQVEWRPYRFVDDAVQPWVEEGRPFFGKEIYIHCQNEILLLRLQMVARTLGLTQMWLAIPPARFSGVSSRGRTRTVEDWRTRHREPVADWERRGRAVVSAAPNSNAYLRHYAARHGAHFRAMLEEVSIMCIFFPLVHMLFLTCGHITG